MLHSVKTTVIFKPCPSDDPVEKVYRKKYDQYGNAYYVVIGEQNIREVINSYRAGCSLQDLLQRCQFMNNSDKINVLNQRSDGVSADTTTLPKDGTSAYMELFKFSNNHPDLVKRLNGGESFDSILMSLLATNTQTPKEKESEVINDVKNESGNA